MMVGTLVANFLLSYLMVPLLECQDKLAKKDIIHFPPTGTRIRAGISIVNLEYLVQTGHQLINADSIIM